MSSVQVVNQCLFTSTPPTFLNIFKTIINFNETTTFIQTNINQQFSIFNSESADSTFQSVSHSLGLKQEPLSENQLLVLFTFIKHILCYLHLSMRSFVRQLNRRTTQQELSLITRYQNKIQLMILPKRETLEHMLFVKTTGVMYQNNCPQSHKTPHQGFVFPNCAISLSKHIHADVHACPNMAIQ